MLLSFLSQSVVRPFKYFGEIPLPKNSALDSLLQQGGRRGKVGRKERCGGWVFSGGSSPDCSQSLRTYGLHRVERPPLFVLMLFIVQ